MPLYEYECQKCGHRFELMQKMSDPPRRRCPECRGKVEKLISSPAFQFKGSGWYVTDYADKGKKKDSADGESKPKDSDAKDSKSDSKKTDSPTSSSSSQKSDSKKKAD